MIELIWTSFLFYIPASTFGAILIMIVMMFEGDIEKSKSEIYKQKITEKDKKLIHQNTQISKEYMELIRQSTQAPKEDIYKVRDYNTNSISIKPIFEISRYNYFLNRAEFWDGKEWREMK